MNRFLVHIEGPGGREYTGAVHAASSRVAIARAFDRYEPPMPKGRLSDYYTIRLDDLGKVLMVGKLEVWEDQYGPRRSWTDAKYILASEPMPEGYRRYQRY